MSHAVLEIKLGEAVVVNDVAGLVEGQADSFSIVAGGVASRVGSCMRSQHGQSDYAFPTSSSDFDWIEGYAMQSSLPATA